MLYLSSKLDEEAEVNDFVNKDLKGIMNFLFPGYENAKQIKNIDILPLYSIIHICS